MDTLDTASSHRKLDVTSKVFQANGSMPTKYTCEGEDINPPLEIVGIPDSAKSLALIMDDPDAPGRTWLHWTVWNIPVTNQVRENEVPGKQGRNDFGRNNYGGPCPPSGTHRYFFKVYALDTVLALKEGSSRQALEQAMHGHIVAYGELVGLYKKSGR